MYDLVVFDLDGTLIDSIGDIADALNETLAGYRRGPLDDAAVARMVGAGVRELVRRALEATGGADEAMLAEVAARYRARYVQWPVRRTSLYLGVKPTLEQLTMDKAVATNKPGALARRILDELGVVRQFAAVLGEDDVGRTKPDPLIVDLCRGKVGAARARTLYVGDSLIDAATAEAAGVDLALVTWGYADPAAVRAHPARFHVERFVELLRVVAG